MNDGKCSYHPYPQLTTPTSTLLSESKSGPPLSPWQLSCPGSAAHYENDENNNINI